MKSAPANLSKIIFGIGSAFSKGLGSAFSEDPGAGPGPLYKVFLYIQLSPIEIICVLNILAENTLFLTKEERNKVAVSELKEINFI